MLAPIVLFTYNRLYHVKQTVDALAKNYLASDSHLIIYSDGPKNEDDNKKIIDVRSYLSSVTGFDKIDLIFQPKNLGLSKSIINGVSEIVYQYGKVIVLEDDLVTAPYFLKYMNEALDKYEFHENVVSIHGYMYPVQGRLPDTFFLRGADCWGWATWKRGWDLFNKDGRFLLNELKKQGQINKFNFNGFYLFSKMLEDQISGINDSWAIRWYASAFLANKLTLYPGKSLVANIGFDNTGVHCGYSNSYSVFLYSGILDIKDIPVKENYRIFRKMIKYYKSIYWKGFINRFKKRLSNRFFQMIKILSHLYGDSKSNQ